MKPTKKHPWRRQFSDVRRKELEAADAIHWEVDDLDMLPIMSDYDVINMLTPKPERNDDDYVV